MFVYSELQRKESAVEAQPCKIDKAVTLTGDRFEYFKTHLLESQDFIRDNVDLMYQSDDKVNHCLLVLSENSADGILVESEGYDYARYSAFVPNAKHLYQLDQYSYLASFVSKIMDLTEEYAKKAVEGQQEGSYRILISDIQNELMQNNIYDMPDDLLSHMFSERPEVKYIEEMDGELFIDLMPEFVEAVDTEKLRKLAPEDVDVMCAKHTLWLNNCGGEQADFSNCLLTKELDFSHRKLNNAVFDNSRLDGLCMANTELCLSSFENAKIVNCFGMDITAEEATFKNAKFVNCSFDRAQFTHSNFANARFCDTAIDGGSLQNCCIENSDISQIKSRTLNLNGCNRNEQEWSDDSTPILSM